MKQTKKINKMYYPRNIKPILANAVKLNLPALLIGETGTGKTSFIYDLAKSHKHEVIRINLTGQTGVDELIGKYLANKNGTYWVDGLLTTAMKQGKWVVLDEINMALPEILSKLHSLLDDDRKIILNEKEGEVITPHKDFRFFATMNPNDEYAGTKELNKAFLSRFPIILDIGYSKKEIDILINKTGIDIETAKQLVLVAKEIRDNKSKENLTYCCSTRDLLYCASLIKEGMRPLLAMEVSMTNKAPAEERLPLKKLITLITGKEIKVDSKHSYTSVEEMVKALEELHETLETEQIARERVNKNYNDLYNRKDELEDKLNDTKDLNSTLKSDLEKEMEENTKLTKLLKKKGIKIPKYTKKAPFKIGDKITIINDGKHNYIFTKEGSTGIITDILEEDGEEKAGVEFDKMTGGKSPDGNKSFNVYRTSLEKI